MINTFSLSFFYLRVLQFFILGTLVCAFALPYPTFAATTRPFCELSVATPAGKITIEDDDVLLREGERMAISWKSKNAKEAKDDNGKTIPLSGTATVTPTRTTSYDFTFTSGRSKTTCTVTAVVVGVEVTSSLYSRSQKPTISGTASGTKELRFIVRKEGSSKILYTSKTIHVTKGKWKSSVTKTLPYGTYDLEFLGARDVKLNSITHMTLTLGTSTAPVASSISVALIPLLSGGVIRPGTTVPVSYLQIQNTGKSTTTLQGFTVQQNGSAPTASIIGLSTVDDRGGARGFAGGIEGLSPFKDGKAFVPVTNVTLAPGEMRLYTIKATLTQNASAYIGKQLMLDVVGTSAAGGAKGAFPIRGTTWTIVK